jgi:hypothetical protein
MRIEGPAPHEMAGAFVRIRCTTGRQETPGWADHRRALTLGRSAAWPCGLPRGPDETCLLRASELRVERLIYLGSHPAQAVPLAERQPLQTPSAKVGAQPDEGAPTAPVDDLDAELRRSEH